jgi:hypothetical protein
MGPRKAAGWQNVTVVSVIPVSEFTLSLEMAEKKCGRGGPAVMPAGA